MELDGLQFVKLTCRAAPDLLSNILPCHIKEFIDAINLQLVVCKTSLKIDIILLLQLQFCYKMDRVIYIILNNSRVCKLQIDKKCVMWISKRGRRFQDATERKWQEYFEHIGHNVSVYELTGD